MNKSDQKKYKKVLKKIGSQVKKIKNTFFKIRDLVSNNKFKDIQIEKNVKGNLITDTIQKDGYKLHCIKVFDAEQNNLLYEILYGVSGVSIRVGEDPHVVGIYYIKFSDFNCDNIEEVEYNHLTVSNMKCYKLKVDKEGNITGSCEIIDRPYETFFSKVFGFPFRLARRLFK